jgi:predicted flap endonuclease-1-like 5' DNA nuclease
LERRLAALEPNASRASELEGTMSAQAAELERRARERSEIEKERRVLERDLRERDAVDQARAEQLAKVQTSFEEQSALAAKRMADLRETREEARDAKKQIAALSASHKAVQLKLDRLAADLATKDEAEKARAEEVRALKAELRDSATRIKGLERDLARAESALSSAKEQKPVKAAKPAKPKHAEPDPLQEIAGIGPETEKKLRRLGIRTFAKLGELDKDGVERIAEKLGVSAQRIRRERWITVAKRKSK